jgi:diguanylate cyclase (GGDEF)-like protein/PAS domain S-box-containing protein
MRPRVVVPAYLTGMLVLTAGYYALPTWQVELKALIGLAGAGAVVVGVRLNRPTHPVPWWLLGAAITTNTAGGVVYGVLTSAVGPVHPDPSGADALFLTVCPFGAAGLLLIVRHRTGGYDRDSLLDALSATVALGLLLWLFLIDPSVRDPALDWPQRAIAIALPLGDVLLLAVLVRLVITGGRERAALLLGAGAVAMLVSDVLYGLLRFDGSWPPGGPYDLGWLVFCAAWGAAALDPSMARLAVPAPRPSAGVTRPRVALLAAVSLIAPGALLADSAAGGGRNGPVIAVCSAVLFLLVLSRLAGVVRRDREAVERERTLRSAGAALVSATGIADVAASVRTAVAQLVPPGEAHRATLLVHAQEPDGPAAVPSGTSGIVAAEALDARTAEAAHGFSTVLVCPLLRHDRPTAGSPIGVLVVGACEGLLLTLQGALEVLAGQAALAVERVALAREMGRRDNEAYFRTLVHNATDVILILTADDRVRYASPSAAAVLGPGPVVGAAVLDLVDPRDRDAAERALAAAARADRPDHGSRSFRVVRVDGEVIDVEVAYRDLRADPTVHGTVLTLRDVTEQRRLQRELTRRAFHDALTGLANRVLFQDRVEQALTGTGAGRRRGPVGVLLVDLDEFKLVNDTMGHGSGDDVLVAVAERLGDLLAPGDTAARLGGDEFAILLADAADAAEVERTAARVVEALGAPFDVAGGLALTVSVGVAGAGVADGPAELLRQADLALNAAKAAGKNGWCRYEPGLHLAAVDRVAVRTELRQALGAGEFAVRYQPIVDLAGGQTVGFEALVRWFNPRRRPVPPAEFIPIAEETGLIVPLGEWVLDRALADLAHWRERTTSPVRVNVNVSAHQLRARGFVDHVRDALARAGVPAAALALEITETALLSDDAEVTTNLAALREHGVRIAIDDFGTGFASLDYIRLHAVDSLKIDRSFVDGVEGSRRQTALVGTIVHLAHALNLPVVAEGVETPAQRDALLLVGCRLGQGHLFSVPIPADAALAWLLDGPPAALGALAPATAAAGDDGAQQPAGRAGQRFPIGRGGPA